MKTLPRSLEPLVAAVERGLRPKYLYFWGHQRRADGAVREECLSQWYTAPFEMGGVRYPTAEHFMMAEKARLFGDEDALRRVLETPHPGAAKRIGREVLGFDQAVWEANRYQIVVRGNRAKFGQHEPLGDYLAGTRHRVLVEASPRDRVWGIGLTAEDARAARPDAWRGLNLLGFALMDVRDAERTAPRPAADQSGRE